MSGFLAVAYDNHIELLTDGAVYEPDGTLTDIRSKVRVISSPPMAITGRGSMAAIDAIAAVASVLGARRDFGQTLDALERTIARKAGAWPEQWEIIVVGFLEERGPGIYYMASADIYSMPDFEPYTFIDAGRDLAGGATPEAVQAINPDLMADAAVNGVAKIAVPLFEAMRAEPGLNPARPDLPPVHGIGGHIDHTVLTMDGGRTERIHVWPDVVGERIFETSHARQNALKHGYCQI